jgi:phosphatidate cytidylyltransferase
MTWFLFRAPLNQLLAGSAALVAGVGYCFLPWRYAVEIRLAEPWWLVYGLTLNWVGDAAAFLAGRSFGRNKLAPAVSPGKTWEGTLASVATSVVFGMALMHTVSPSSSPWKVAIVSAAANGAGQIGDLCESALKRGAGIKDSGTMLGSHGGWLDRVDANLFSLPVVWALLDWLR